MIYKRSKWYWLVGADTENVYSSASSNTLPVTDSGYVAWLAAGGHPTKITADDMLLMRIEMLEEKITPRRLRDALLGTDGGWLESMETQIAALRAQFS